MSDKSLITRLVLAVIILWILAFVAIVWTLPDWEKRGQFGDLFGAVNALFSGLAFAGLIFAGYLQHKQLTLQMTELSLQREELRLQREEMTASRAELANQAQAQYALFRATVAQVTVAATQARIEAVKMRHQDKHPMVRSDLVADIDFAASALDALAKELELQLPHA